ncbi:unnamed protein product [Parnassius apollo]|uniref:(apollo) hypothetical protein n=1 Tax=Parnassius apollo TaxID=110799 RepID=A0A8S3WBK3_PARAO|nr:unnamed protein product [Parnassius apollo]
MDFRIEIMQVVNKYWKRNRNPFHIDPSPQQSTYSNLSVNANNPESPYSSNSYIATPRQYTEPSVNIASTSTSNTYLVESPEVYQSFYPSTSTASDETQVATSSIKALLNQNFDK